MLEPEYKPRITLHVRSLCPPGADHLQREIVERVRTIDERGQIDGWSLEVWGDRIPSDPQTAASSATLERIETFEAWSDRAGTSLSPFFEVREAGTLLADNPRKTVVPPVICLAEYHEDTLQYVAPCVDNDTVCTVVDRLNTIERNIPDVEA